MYKNLKTTKRQSYAFFGLVLIVILTSAFVVSAQTGKYNRMPNLINNQSIEKELTSIAKVALEAESQLYAADSGEVKDTTRLQDAMQNHFAEAIKNREESSARGFYYKNAQSTILYVRSEIAENSASLFLKEHRQRVHVSPTNEETQIEEFIEHRFDFSLKLGQWYLERDIHLNAPKPLPTITDEEPTADTSTDVSDFISFDTQHKDEEPEASRVYVIRSWIVAYAYQYYQNPNPSYRTFGNDCTNFTSQALTYGGWTQILGYYTSDSAWWYKPTCNWYDQPCQSYTWAGANNFYRNIRYKSGRATLASHISNLRAGDILQVDWYGDGTTDHSMVVTKVVNGLPYLTYRSESRKDKPFSELRSSFPAAKWYGFNLKSSY